MDCKCRNILEHMFISLIPKKLNMNKFIGLAQFPPVSQTRLWKIGFRIRIGGTKEIKKENPKNHSSSPHKK